MTPHGPRSLVQLLTPTHPTDPTPRRARCEASRPIVIEDNVWLGGGAAVGTPATVIRPLDAE